MLQSRTRERFIQHWQSTPLRPPPIEPPQERICIVAAEQVSRAEHRASTALACVGRRAELEKQQQPRPGMVPVARVGLADSVLPHLRRSCAKPAPQHSAGTTDYSQETASAEESSAHLLSPLDAAATSLAPLDPYESVRLFSAPPRCGRRFKGVRRRQWGRHTAEIRDAIGKRVWLGSYDSEEEAARAYDRAARILQGEGAWLNFPDEDPARVHVELPPGVVQALIEHRGNVVYRQEARRGPQQGSKRRADEGEADALLKKARSSATYSPGHCKISVCPKTSQILLQDCTAGGGGQATSAEERAGARHEPTQDLGAAELKSADSASLVRAATAPSGSARSPEVSHSRLAGPGENAAQRGCALASSAELANEHLAREMAKAAPCTAMTGSGGKGLAPCQARRAAGGMATATPEARESTPQREAPAHATHRKTPFQDLAVDTSCEEELLFHELLRSVCWSPGDGASPILERAGGRWSGNLSFSSAGQEDADMAWPGTAPQAFSCLWDHGELGTVDMVLV